MKKLLKISILTLLVLVVLFIGFILFTFPVIMTGMGAKTMCSCVFVTGRDPESVKQQELQVFPGLSSADIEVNYTDSTVTALLIGQTAKAIFRKGLGCTLLAEQSEEEVRSQPFKLRDWNVPVNQDTILWPQGNKLDTVVESGINQTLLSTTLDSAFFEKDPEKPVRTHAVVVVYKGKIIAERYASGLNYNSRLKGWSMTKTMTQAMVGLLVKDGKIRIDDPAPIQEWQSDERKKITVNNLLQATSGLAWAESYFNPYASFHEMFIRSDDKAGYAATLALEHEPGTHWEYSSASTNLLSRIVRQETGDDYHRFPYERLFHKIGMNQAVIEPDAAGTFVGSSYGYASARDWARFGLLYLNDGVWNGERILPEGWVKYSTTPVSVAPKGEYGAQIWLNAGSKSNPEHCQFKGIPHDAFVFDGFEENNVTVIPSYDLIIVRLGVTHHGNFDHTGLVNGVIESLPKK
jgi:CubicO group peptidase (beta-lactamase class C family)